MKIRPCTFATSAALALLAAALLGPAAQAVPFAISSDGNAVVRILPQTAAPALNTGLVTAAYPGWTVTNGGAVNGSFATSTYTAGWSGGSGGAQFAGNYTQASPVGAGSQLNYIQIINTNLPLGGASSPYIDPQPNDDNLPFYWTSGEAAAKGGPANVNFSDFSRRDPASLSSTNPITWSANLYPVIYDGATGVVVGPGVQWGWTMKQATVGQATATFNGPSPTCPPATCSGIGTDTIAWGDGQQGGLSFAGAAFAPTVGTPFKIGTLSYTNGSTAVGSALDGISLDIALAFDNVSEANFIFHTGLTINNTPNSDDPIASADFVRFAAGGFSDSFHVLEGASATADLMARLTPILGVTPSLVGDKDPTTVPDPISVIGYNLELVALANPSAGGFVVTAVSLPGTPALFALGLFGAFWARRRRAQDA